MAVRVVVRYNGNVEGETRYVNHAIKDTLDVVLHIDSVQDMGNV